MKIPLLFDLDCPNVYNFNLKSKKSVTFSECTKKKFST